MEIKTFLPTAKTTPYLQQDLAAEISNLLSNLEFKKADGTKQIGATGYLQQLSKLESDDADPDQYFPYFIVRHIQSVTKSDMDPWTVTMHVLLGVYDDGAENAGHFQLENACQRITDRFIYEPLLSHSWRCEQEIEIDMQEDDTYPYFFGGVELKFQVPKIRRNDEYS
jgi:hypothetical protein